METGYEEEDYGAVASLLQDWTPNPLPSPNWRGVVDPNRVLDPPAQPTGKKDEPTVVVGWRIEYTLIDPAYDDQDDNPYREGAVVIRVSTEIGAGTGIAKSLFRQIRWLFGNDAGDHPLTWLEDEGRPSVLGVRSDWWVEEMRLPFIGG